MSVDLSVGAVPILYKEVHSLLNPNDRNEIDRELFSRLLASTNLPKATIDQDPSVMSEAALPVDDEPEFGSLELPGSFADYVGADDDVAVCSEVSLDDIIETVRPDTAGTSDEEEMDDAAEASVWEYAGAKQGPVTPTSLYRSLALVAIAQQGRQLDEKTLLNLEVLPNPSLPSPAELREKLGLTGRKMMSLDLKSGGSDPRILNTSYAQMVAQDTIRVALVPEKKGIILKHVVYEVSSQRYQSRVERRYNDFVTLFDILVQRFPYRADVQARLKEYCKNVPDEFLTSEVARRSDELVSSDTTVQFAMAREQLRQVYICLSQLREATQRMVDRSKMAAVDILVVSKEFATLSNISKLESDWATGGNDAWNIVQKALRSLQGLLVPIHEAHSEQSLHEEEEVLEELNLFLDLLVAYKALCDRHESGVVLGHHKAINRMVKKSSNSFGAVDPMKQAQELEHRTQFSLHCVHLESQMVYAHMEALGGITRALVRIQANGHAKLGALWSSMAPAVATMVPNAGTQVPQ
ncbi:hypothetical protein HPB52_020143 [Rhipicephalus sanguineus]|uniref:PX domain-containing protein n=1 Tax=Rhipicephalus sanguineus TaxID=34632 RepID=A0A9D4PM16_RHISA|nr:hypothetical protein HPB52_020143 [Rhipicephalus sanguineus]